MPKNILDEGLRSAILSNNTDKVQEWLEQGANPNYDTGTNESPLVDAAHTPRQHKIVALLLKHGAQVDMVIENQKVLISPLHWAAYKATMESHESLDHMLAYDKKGAFRTLKDGRGNTPYDDIKDKALQEYYDDLLKAEMDLPPPLDPLPKQPTSPGRLRYKLSRFSQFFPFCLDPEKSPKIGTKDYDAKNYSEVELRSIGKTSPTKFKKE